MYVRRVCGYTRTVGRRGESRGGEGRRQKDRWAEGRGARGKKGQSVHINARAAINTETRVEKTRGCRGRGVRRDSCGTVRREDNLRRFWVNCRKRWGCRFDIGECL